MLGTCSLSISWLSKNLRSFLPWPQTQLQLMKFGVRGGERWGYLSSLERRCARLCAWSGLRLGGRELPCWLSRGKSAHKAGDVVLVPELGRSPGGGHGNPSQYSWLENPMDRGAWWSIASQRVRQDWSDWAHAHMGTQGEANMFSFLQLVNKRTHSDNMCQAACTRSEILARLKPYNCSKGLRNTAWYLTTQTLG